MTSTPPFRVRSLSVFSFGLCAGLRAKLLLTETFHNGVHNHLHHLEAELLGLAEDHVALDIGPVLLGGARDGHGEAVVLGDLRRRARFASSSDHGVRRYRTSRRVTSSTNCRVFWPVRISGRRRTAACVRASTTVTKTKAARS